MRKPQFSIRTFLIAAVLIGFVGIPVGYDQYLKWQSTTAIPVFYTNAEEVAAVLRAVYADKQSGASPFSMEIDGTSNTVIVAAPQEMVLEIQELVAAIDTPPIASVVIAPLSTPNPKTIEESLRRILDDR